IWVITDPSRAFWDIVHYRRKIGSGWVILFTGLLFGLQGLAAYSHMSISFPGGLMNWYLPIFNMLSVFLLYTLFGLVYYSIFFKISNFVFSFTANYSIDLSKQMDLRYGDKEQMTEEEIEEEETKILSMKESEGGYLGDLPAYLKAEGAKKGSIMNMAYTPMLIVLAISALIAWILTPPFSAEDASLALSSPAWGIIDWFYMIVFIGWVPITMSIALREMANSSTQRVYISCVISAVIVCIFFFFARPTILFQY
ncbi:MAG: hypothetical protein GY870_22530, partial [archaeon]|nr:hypothetical protein [archaeon]